jgi:Ca2+-binding EF-hand superfamily protein
MLIELSFHCKYLKTKFDEARIRTWYQAFSKECPDGKLTRDHLTKLFKKVFPTGDGEIFCDHIFRVFDDDGSNTLEFTVSYKTFDFYAIYMMQFLINLRQSF